jgi:ribosomal protein S18 acetylase RimI-like enzyme
MLLKIDEIQVIDKDIEELSELLQLVVDDGASIGFLPPIKHTEAIKYWRSVLKPEVVLFVARINNQLAGSVQLNLDTKENGSHRAEVGKLMTHPNFRRTGIGRSLMEKAEDRAKLENRSLIVLDTREGDPSNNLYQSLNYIEGGKIPYYARSANGELHTTVFYYKKI